MNTPLFDLAPKFDSGIPLTQTDHIRLGAQLQRVLAVMEDGDWWTVGEIHDAIWQATGVRDPETSISAQCRNLRKAKFGGHVVERRRMNGVYEFRLVKD